MRRFFFNYKESGGGGGSSPEAKAKNAGSYGGTDRGTINSVADLEAFLTTYDVENGKFGDLALGDSLKINDGTYNTDWGIAEFDFHCDAASDFDAPYINNFHNLALIPKTLMINETLYYMYGSGSTSTCTTAYKGSKMNLETLPEVITSMKTVLGDHMKPFYQYVSNANNDSGSGEVTGYEWLSKEAILMSEYQCFGDVTGRLSVEPVQAYEHKLPLLKVTPYGTNKKYWLRSMGGILSSVLMWNTFCDFNGGVIDRRAIKQNYAGLCPIIMIA